MEQVHEQQYRGDPEPGHRHKYEPRPLCVCRKGAAFDAYEADEVQHL